MTDFGWIYDRWLDAQERGDEPPAWPLPIRVEPSMPPDTVAIFAADASLTPIENTVCENVKIDEGRKVRVVLFGGRGFGKRRAHECAVAMEVWRLGLLGLVP